MVGLHAIFASHSSQLHPSQLLPASRPRRPREAMALSLAETRGRCDVPPTAVNVKPYQQRLQRRSPRRRVRALCRPVLRSRALSGLGWTRV
eukprot:600915-Prymnesium_polylepis.1